MFCNIWRKCWDNISIAMKDWKYFWYVSAIFCAMWDTHTRTHTHPCCKFRNENRLRFNPYISDLFRSIMTKCEICFRGTDSFVVKVRITPSDYDSFFFSPNWCLKFIPNDSAPIRKKFSFRLNPFNSVKSFRLISRHSPFSPNDSVAHSNGLD